MKRKLAFIITLSLIIMLNLYYETNAQMLNLKKQDKLILIDPGHGGMDGGAVGSDGTLEKNINLKISNKLKQQFIKEGYKVIMTREDDRALHGSTGTIRNKKIEDLNNRQKMIKDTNCDMFISIHLNMFPQKQYYGAQVWYASNEASRKFALMIQNCLKQGLDTNNKREAKGAKDTYIILRNPINIPAVIVECGFLSNYEESRKLKDDNYQQKIAETIVNCANNYFNEE